MSLSNMAAACQGRLCRGARAVAKGGVAARPGGVSSHPAKRGRRQPRIVIPQQTAESQRGPVKADQATPLPSAPSTSGRRADLVPARQTQPVIWRVGGAPG